MPGWDPVGPRDRRTGNREEEERARKFAEEERKRKEAEEREARKAEFEEIAEKLKGQTLKIGAKAGTSGKIFGSITNIQIANALKEQFDVEVERRDIVLPDEVKEVGTYTVTLKLHPEVQPEVEFEVVQE